MQDATAPASASARADGAGWWARVRRFVPFVGPAFLVSVGYMDPGNWATNIEGGSKFGYTLLWVLLLSNLMALLLQALSAKLGVATGETLARTIRQNTTKPVAITLWLTAEAAAIATDLAEFLGAAFGFYLLLHVPLLVAAILTGVIVFLILGLHRFGHRAVELVIIALVAVIAAAYLYEVLIAKPDWASAGHGLVAPNLPSAAAAIVAVGMIGATVMPHNIFLGSHVVQARRGPSPDITQKKRLYKLSILDLAIALNLAWLVNSAMLIMSAAAFPGGGITDLQHAHSTLSPLLGAASSVAFAVALLAAGLSSSVTGTLAGQTIMEGFIGYRMNLFLRRSLTMVPAIVAIAWLGESSSSLLVLSQVVLSLQLPFTILPLIWLTSRRDIMGELANSRWMIVAASLVATIIVAFNAYLLWQLVAG